MSPSASRIRAAASALPSVPMMMTAGSPGNTRTTTNTSTETKTRVATSAATLRRTKRRKDARPGAAAYFCQAISERSKTGSGRSFQIPVTPFLATTRFGCMNSHTAGASSASMYCIFR